MSHYRLNPGLNYLGVLRDHSNHRNRKAGCQRELKVFVLPNGSAEDFSANVVWEEHGAGLRMAWLKIPVLSIVG